MSKTEAPVVASNSLLGGECLICGKPVPDYKPVYCCNGRDCGCMGKPLEPCVCSFECSTALFHGIGKSYEQRRMDAGIPPWTPNTSIDARPVEQTTKEARNQP